MRQSTTQLSRVLPALVLLAATLQAATGEAVPGMEQFDGAMTQIIQRWNLPGGSLAIVRDGRLVHARGYGWANRELREPVQPDSLFRIGSLSKPVTAVAILQLAQAGKLRLDAPVTDLLADLLPSQEIVDARWRRITVRHLLQHSGGWDLERSYDPMAPPPEVIQAWGLRPPVSCAGIARRMLREPLQFDPGSRAAYSNFGYCLLGRVVEKAGGEAYVEYVRKNVLRPLGIFRANQGAALPSGRHLGEVDYYDEPGAAPYPNLYRGGQELISPANGGVPMEHLDSTGGWVMSAPDLVRFLYGVDGRGVPALLGPAMLAEMTARPSYVPRLDPAYYALGWIVQPLTGGYAWAHSGYIEGAASMLLRVESDGLGWAVLFNGGVPEDKQDQFFEEVHNSLASLALAPRTWPLVDQFPRYFTAGAPRIVEAGPASAASLASQGFVPGELIAVTGEFLGPAELVVAAPGPEERFPVELAGVRLLVNGVPAPLLAVSENQVNAIVPFSAAGQLEASLELEWMGRRSNARTVALLAARPGLFTRSSNGRGLACALNQDGATNEEARPAARGSSVALFGTGAGTMSAPVTDGAPVRTPLPAIVGEVRVLIGGHPAPVEYAGAAPGLVAGVVQINARVPADIPPGEQPIEIEIAGQRSRPAVSIWVQ